MTSTKQPTELYRKYKAGTMPPRQARCCLKWWGFVAFFKNQKEAEEFRETLPYYEWEDAMVLPVEWHRR